MCFKAGAYQGRVLRVYGTPEILQSIHKIYDKYTLTEINCNVNLGLLKLRDWCKS